MSSTTFVRRTRLGASAEIVLAWHARPGAFERLTPPWEHVEVIERRGGIGDGGRAALVVHGGPFRLRWVAEHHDLASGLGFRDVQVEGPFASWQHTHQFVPEGCGACEVVDQIEYRLPLGWLGRILGSRMIRRKLNRLFAYRHRVTADDLAQHAAWKGQAMNILVTGASGLIGSALVPFLTTGGHTVTQLVRPRHAADGVFSWGPSAGQLDPKALAGIDAVVHLAGESIAVRRWNAEQKRRIMDSRVQGTRLLCERLAGLERPPRVLVSASAIGFYGDRGEETLTEESAPGSGFLTDVCRAWEEATKAARDRGIRVVHTRFGIVLSPKGGALAKMLTPFQLGAGGVIGGGRQYMSWVALDDAIGAIHHALIADSLSGPVNVVAPQPVTNREFTKTLGRVIGRPTVFPMPAFAARLAFGEMADALLLASTRVQPSRLLADGYRFRFTDLKCALRHQLGR
jgi:uncharacterized protein